MRTTLLASAVLLSAGASLTGCASAPRGTEGEQGPTLRPFRSEAEILAYHQQLLREYEEELENLPPPPPAPPPPPPPPPPPAPPPSAPGQVSAPPPSTPQPSAPAAAAPAAATSPAGAAQAAPGAAANESVTNVQHAGVDEGGIVKVHGDYLVILRRGRLFTVRIGDGALQPVAAVDAFGPGIDPRGSWYDELLLSGDQVVVIGYSYDRGGTELGLFRIGTDGSLTHRATYQLRSGDYYSSRNYASRLIGTRLIFYSPLPLDLEADAEDGDPWGSYPAFRRWGAADTTWRRTTIPRRVYRAAGPVSLSDDLMLHTVTVCEMGGDELECEATSLYGPEGREFYVSPSAVYVWATQYPQWSEEDEDDSPRSVLYRMPLDGRAPTGLRVSGGPLDQFSFLESGDGHLNVLVAAEGGGAGMWDAELDDTELALLRVPVSSFGDGSRAAAAHLYRRLPMRDEGGVQNRYVGDWLLYGPGNLWGRPEDRRGGVFAVRWADAASPVAELPLPHGVDRIEQMGSGAVVIGAGGRDLHFSGVRLGASAELAHRYTRTGASQGETRSHGFFYRPDGEDVGILGLPIRGPGRPGYEHLQIGSASILFLRNQAFQLRELGDLAANETNADDLCAASCVDWYGNARPLFLRGRIFALMGYELVEGAENDGRIREVRRVNYLPPLPPVVFAGRWRFNETLRGAGGYWCSNDGTFDFATQGERLDVSYRQQGRCIVDGRSVNSAGDGSGSGTAGPREVSFILDTCRYTGRMRSAFELGGDIRCRLRRPDGSEQEVTGNWSATRS